MRSFSGRWWDCWINDLHGPSAVFIKEYLSGDYAAIWEAITNDSIKRTFVKGDFTQVKFPQQTEDYSSFLSVFLIKIIESPTAPTITPNSENGKSLRLCKRVLFISAPPRQRSIPNSIKAMPFKDLLSMIEIPFQSQICRIDTHKV